MTGTISVTSTNPLGVDVQNFQIEVRGIPPQIASAPPLTVAVGAPYAYTVTATGAPAPTLGISTLPGWLTFNAATGELTGVPATANIGLSQQITITASNGWAPVAAQSFQITVEGIPPAFISSPPIVVTVGQPYQYLIAVTAAPVPALSLTSAPSWLSLTGNVLSGTPSNADYGLTAPITLTASNGWPPSAVQTFQIDVLGIAPVFTSTPLINATPTLFYSYPVAVSGTPQPTLSVSTILPSWLTFDSGTGVLSGTPPSSTAETMEFIAIAAANGVLPSATQSFTLEIGPAPAVPPGEEEKEKNEGCSVSGAGTVALRPALLLAGVAVWRRRRRGAR
jgi:hypothetical protein